MNAIDIVIILIGLFFCVKGYFHGFVNELFSLIIIVAGLVFAFFFSRPVAHIFDSFVENKDLALILAFAGIFFVVTVLLIMIRNTLLNIIERVNFTDADSIFGALIGLFKGAFLCGLIFMFLKNHEVLHLEKPIHNSLIFPYLERAVTTLILLFPERIVSIIQRVLAI